MCVSGRVCVCECVRLGGGSSSSSRSIQAAVQEVVSAIFFVCVRSGVVVRVCMCMCVGVCKFRKYSKQQFKVHFKKGAKMFLSSNSRRSPRRSQRTFR